MQNKTLARDYSKKALEFLSNNKVMLLFLALSVFGLATAGRPVEAILAEVFTRFGRNTFLVLALIIPVVAGLGLNFGIVVGAVAAQIAVFCTVYWNVSGIAGIGLCLAIGTPLAILFGWLVGKLYNKTKGTEMITGLVLGYFADGLYQLLFLFIIGGVIPVKESSPLIIPGGVGVKNTIDLTGVIKYTIDDISMYSMVWVLAIAMIVVSVALLIIKAVKKQNLELKTALMRIGGGVILIALTFIPFVNSFLDVTRLVLLDAIELGCVVFLVYAVWRYVNLRFIKKEEDPQLKRSLAIIIAVVVIYALTYLDLIYKITLAVELPVCTYLLIIGLYSFNKWLLKTKIGQNMRSVGQNRMVANSAGINVNNTRIIAMCFSTVFACWGQLIYLQNLGTFATYGAHTNVGLYAIAALLVGGASVQKADSSHAVTGVLLFHTLFVVAPLSASNLLGSALIGEYFRVFLCYGVIAAALAMHAWKKVAKPSMKTADKLKTRRSVM